MRISAVVAAAAAIVIESERNVTFKLISQCVYRIHMCILLHWYTPHTRALTHSRHKENFFYLTVGAC